MLSNSSSSWFLVLFFVFCFRTLSHTFGECVATEKNLLSSVSFSLFFFSWPFLKNIRICNFTRATVSVQICTCVAIEMHSFIANQSLIIIIIRLHITF